MTEMRQSDRHLVVAVASSSVAVAVAGVAVDVTAIYWALATSGLVTLATMAAHKWMPCADPYVGRFIGACASSALIAAIAGVVVFRDHGIRAVLVGVATLLAGLVAIVVGGRLWVSRWTVRRIRRRLWNRRRDPSR